MAINIKKMLRQFHLTYTNEYKQIDQNKNFIFFILNLGIIITVKMKIYNTAYKYIV